MQRPLLEVVGLRKTFAQGDDTFVAADDVSFVVPAGRTVALVGEVEVRQDDDGADGRAHHAGR